MSTIESHVNPELWDEKGEAKEKIALLYSLQVITDDNQSLTNGLSSLEQIIMYEFDLNNKSELYDMVEEISDLEVHFDVFKLRKILTETIFQDEEELVLKLAKGRYKGILTDDNVSKWTWLTSLEEAILYEFGPVSEERLSELKSKVSNKESDLKGGCRLRDISALTRYKKVS